MVAQASSLCAKPPPPKIQKPIVSAEQRHLFATEEQLAIPQSRVSDVKNVSLPQLPPQ